MPRFVSYRVNCILLSGIAYTRLHLLRVNVLVSISHDMSAVPQACMAAA